MEVGTVCISTDEYKTMIETIHEQAHLLKKCRTMLNDAIVPLAEYKSICEYFADRSWERECYDAWLRAKKEQENDCLGVGGTE